MEEDKKVVTAIEAMSAYQKFYSVLREKMETWIKQDIEKRLNK